MLQQTRVAAVLDHYARWMQRFPTVQDLPRRVNNPCSRFGADSATTIALAACIKRPRSSRVNATENFPIRQKLGASFPASDATPRQPSPASPSAKPVAVVDGNVERVLERLFGGAAGRESAWQQAETLLDRTRPGDFNQAMMELGATICTPRAPQCLLCPLYKWCQSRGADTPKPQAPRKRKQLHYALARKQDSVLLVQRPADAARMAECGNFRRQAPLIRPRKYWRSSATPSPTPITKSPSSPAPPALIRSLDGNARWFTRKQWQKLALTGLTRKILRKLVVESASPCNGI